MLWVVLAIPFIITLLYFKAVELLEAFKTTDGDSPNEQVMEVEDKQELVQILRGNRGNIVTIRSNDFTCLYKNRIMEDNREITGKILEVDENWINIEFDSRQFIKKDSLDQLIFRIDRISSFFVNVDSN